jgi:valyl-tRNA synthetase
MNKMLHLFMPFITEEIWHLLRDRKEGDDIMAAAKIILLTTGWLTVV